MAQNSTESYKSAGAHITITSYTHTVSNSIFVTTGKGPNIHECSPNIYFSAPCAAATCLLKKDDSKMMIRRDSGKVSDACVGMYRRTSDYLTNLFVSFSGILHENIDGNTMKARLIF